MCSLTELQDILKQLTARVHRQGSGDHPEQSGVRDKRLEKLRFFSLHQRRYFAEVLKSGRVQAGK